MKTKWFMNSILVPKIVFGIFLDYIISRIWYIKSDKKTATKHDITKKFFSGDDATLILHN